MDGVLRCFENGVKKQWPTVTWLLLKHFGYCRKKPWLLYRYTKDSNVDPAEVSQKGRILLPNPQVPKFVYPSCLLGRQKKAKETFPRKSTFHPI
jgi:hypothetical protein